MFEEGIVFFRKEIRGKVWCPREDVLRDNVMCGGASVDDRV